jgi:hypothetical protein
VILISPYSKKLRRKLSSGKEIDVANPKNYPHWKEVVAELSDVVQIGVTGEEQLVEDFRTDLALNIITDLARECLTWISVDNFFPHLVHYELRKSGVVIWGMSDPKIFGYPENINLLRDEKYLRRDQFDVWVNEPYNSNIFVEPDIVIEAVKSLLAGK